MIVIDCERVILGACLCGVPFVSVVLCVSLCVCVCVCESICMIEFVCVRMCV